MDSTKDKYYGQKKYFTTPNGAQKHRDASKKYYEMNKEAILLKKRLQYEQYKNHIDESINQAQ